MSSSAAVDKSSAVAGGAGGNVSTVTASENSCTLIEDDAAMSTVAAEDVTTTVFPSINSRLANLRPSKDLLDYYRAKIAQYDSEFEVLAQKLDAFKCGYQDQEKLAGEVRQREEEIGQLQKSLSDMQIFLFQEREQVLRLYAENDRLKLRELEDRKKIQHLLSLTGVECGGGDVTYFHKEPPSKVVIPQYRPQTHHLHNSFATNNDSSFSITSEVAASVSENMSLRKAIPAKGAKLKDLRGGSLNATSASFNIPRGGGSSKPAAAENQKHQRQMIASQQHKFSAATKKTASGSVSQKVKEVVEGGGHDVEILRLQIDALHAQMEDQAKLSKDQLTALLEDRKVRQEEWEVGMKREGNRVKELSKQLSQVQELLHEATKEHLQTKIATRQSETKWIHEKDRLMRELDHLKDKLSTSQHKKVEILSESVHDLEVRSVSQKDRIASLQVQLEQSQKLADMYREQIIQLEDEISRIREEGDVGKELFRERTDKMAKRLQLMNQRYESLEQRRNLEVEGFKNDIKLLRTRLKEVERQLYKVTLSFAEPLIREDKDLELLCDVKKTGKRTKAIMEDIHSLKAKIYGLEEDLRKA